MKTRIFRVIFTKILIDVANRLVKFQEEELWWHPHVDFFVNCKKLKLSSLYYSVSQIFDSGSSPSQIDAAETTLASGLTIYENWEVSIDLKLPVQAAGGWRNVFGMQVEGKGLKNQILYFLSSNFDLKGVPPADENADRVPVIE